MGYATLHPRDAAASADAATGPLSSSPVHLGELDGALACVFAARLLFTILFTIRAGPTESKAGNINTRAADYRRAANYPLGRFSFASAALAAHAPRATRHAPRASRPDSRLQPGLPGLPPALAGGERPTHRLAAEPALAGLPRSAVLARANAAHREARLKPADKGNDLAHQPPAQAGGRQRKPAKAGSL